MRIDLLQQTLRGVGVEVGIPAGWAREGGPDDTGVRFLADPQEGYRTNLALSAGALDPPTPAGFEELIAEVPRSFTARHPDAEVLAVRRFVQQGRPACVFRLRWNPASPPPGVTRIDTFEQLLMLLIVDPEQGRLVQFDGTTIAPLAEQDLPLLQAILETARPLADAAPTHGGSTL